LYRFGLIIKKERTIRVNPEIYIGKL